MSTSTLPRRRLPAFNPARPRHSWAHPETHWYRCRWCLVIRCTRSGEGRWWDDWRALDGTAGATLVGEPVPACTGPVQLETRCECGGYLARAAGRLVHTATCPTCFDPFGSTPPDDECADAAERHGRLCEEPTPARCPHGGVDLVVAERTQGGHHIVEEQRRPALVTLHARCAVDGGECSGACHAE